MVAVVANLTRLMRDLLVELGRCYVIQSDNSEVGFRHLPSAEDRSLQKLVVQKFEV